MAMIGALNSQGPATAGVLEGGDVPTGLLDGAAAVRRRRLGGAASPVSTWAAAAAACSARARRGRRPRSIGSTGGWTPGGAGSARGQGPGGQREGRRRRRSPAAASRTPTAVVAGMAAGFRRCYNQGLARNPNMKGSVRITAKIGPNGEVLPPTRRAAALSGDRSFSCVVARVRARSSLLPRGAARRS